MSGSINLQEIHQAWREESGISSTIQYRTSTKNFNNSLLFTVLDENKNKKAIKVFGTGNLHITGYTDINAAIQISDELGRMLSYAQSAQHILQPTSYKVQMINVCYMLPFAKNEGTSLCLMTIKNELSRKCPYYVSYNSNEYAGLIINASNFKVLLFSSGSVIITSVNTVEGVQRAFEYACSMLHGLSGDIYVQKACNGKRKRKQEFDYSMYLQLK